MVSLYMRIFPKMSNTAAFTDDDRCKMNVSSFFFSIISPNVDVWSETGWWLVDVFDTVNRALKAWMHLPCRLVLRDLSGFISSLLYQIHESKHNAKKMWTHCSACHPFILSYDFVVYLSWVCSTAVSRGTWPRGPLSAVKAKEEDLMQASVTG